MFWHLLLAHFLADYPLQPNWMANNKCRIPVLFLHVSTHLVVMLLMVGASRRALWLIGPRLAIQENPTMLVTIPYVASRYGRRAIATDLLVAVGGLFFVLWAH